MLKKGILSFAFLFFVFMLFSCGKEITLSVEDLTVTLKEGETYQVEVVTNDDLVTYVSSDQSILSVSDSGKVEAKKAGTAKVTVTSNKDKNLSVTINVTVEKKITLSVDVDSYTILVDGFVTVTYTSNDEVEFLSSDVSIFTVDATGKVTGLKAGQATLTITSKLDATATKQVSITVRKVIELDLETTYVEMWVGKTESIKYTSNDDVKFVVSDPTIASVSSKGVITGLKNGLVTIEVISTYDETVKDTLSARIYNETETILIAGSSRINVNSVMTLNAEVGPDDAYKYVTWTSSDEEVATISEQGIFTALSVGVVTITATSKFDESLTDEITIEVVNILLVIPNAKEGDIITHSEIVYTFGTDLFSTIQAAANKATKGALITVLAGTYNEDINLEVEDLTLDGTEVAMINGIVTISNEGIKLSNFIFTGDAQITNEVEINGFEFSHNVANQLTKNQNFINLNKVSDVIIYKNTFTNTTGTAISVTNYLSGLIRISNNTITGADTGIKLIAVDNYDPLTEVQIERNIISSVKVGIEVKTISSINIKDKVRFNSVSAYTNLALKANVDHKMDFTLNYWGNDIPVYADFENVTAYDLRGFYEKSADIITEANYKEGYIIKIVPEEKEVEIIIGETVQIGYETLPIEATIGTIRYITSDSEILRIGSTGILNPLRSGSADIIILLTNDTAINTRVNVLITTTPGIELAPSVLTQSFIIGDVFSIDATVFPFAIKDEAVLFETSDALVATIDQEGLVTSHAAGLVTFTASLISDATIKNEFKIEFYNSLNDHNLLDLLTKNQLSYTPMIEYTAYGMGYNYHRYNYESVSRYYFGSIEINQTKMVPVSTGIRPGAPMAPHNAGVTQYNPFNVYYVVIHDTANTGTGAGALSHANYLWNNAKNGVELNASWHFTIDDKELYQHIPETERAYHAGDGSTLAGTTWVDNYLNTHIGGGNRNGIGIETGVNDDADLYRTWQRTAKLVAQLLNRYDLPRENMKYHNDFSGKNCPNTLRTAGLIPMFEKLEDIEYLVERDFSNAEITFVSNDLEYVDNTGRVIKMPDRSMTVSYEITVNVDGIISSRTFYAYLPGTVH